MCRDAAATLLFFALLSGAALAQSQGTGTTSQPADRQAQSERDRRDAERDRKEKNKDGKREPGTRCARWKAGKG